MIPEANIRFICPRLEEEILVFKDLNLNARLSSVALTGGGLLRYLLCSLIPHQLASTVKKKGIAEVRVDKVNTVSRVISRARAIMRGTIDSYLVGKYIGSFLAKSLFSFSAGMFGGHTIGLPSLDHYMVQYEILRSAVNGPMLTSPISISKLSLEHYKQRISTLKRLKRSLRNFDFIYTRGPHSLEILRDRLDIEEGKVAMALDSGFGMRLIHPEIHASKTSGKAALRIVIIPRKEYFYSYDRKDLYKSYLDALANLILWLFRKFDVDVYLATQTVFSDANYNWTSHRAPTDSAIGDLARLLERRSNNRCLKRLKIVEPNNLIDALRLYSSVDLVITARMHAGISAMSAGAPAVFTIPSAEVKILDILTFLGLDISSFLIDVFDVSALRVENFVNKIANVIENLEYNKKIVESAVNKALHTVELPARTLVELLK